MEGSTLGETEVRRRLDSYLIPFDEISRDSCDDFLRVRADGILAVIRDLCGSETGNQGSTGS